MSDDTFTRELKEVVSEAPANEQTFGKNGNQTIREIMADSGFNNLTKESEPEEIHTAIHKFLAVTANFDSTRLDLAKSEIIKKLNEIGVKGTSELVRNAFKKSVVADDSKQGGVILLEDPEPWNQEVAGAELLQEIIGTLRTYTVLPKGADTTIALWILFSWCHDSFYISPILCFSSPVKRCGKSTALRIISKLTPRPLMASNISTAGFFRSIEHFQPSLILDELDTFLNNNPELNGIINCGHDRDGAYVLRCEGDDMVPRPYSVWSPKVFAGIGRRKDTLEDRSITVNMMRKSPSQKVKKLRLDRLDNFKVFRRKAARWAEDYAETLKTVDPVVPEILNDRAQDNWRPLLSVAEIAGGDWPEKAKEAALIFSGSVDLEDDSPPIQLLTDIRAIFEAQGVKRISSDQLVRELIDMEDRLWPEFKDGRSITKTGVALILKPFKVKPKTIRLETGKVLKGYQRDWFDEVFEIYLANTPIPTVTPVTTLQNKELDEFQTVTNNQNVTGGKSKNTIKNKPVTAVTVEKGGIGGIKENGPDIKESATLFGAEEEI